MLSVRRPEWIDVDGRFERPRAPGARPPGRGFMRMCTRFTRVAMSVVSILLVGLAVSGCRKPKAVLAGGPGSASFEAPNGLFTAISISNHGAAPAEDIAVSSIAILGATRAMPASL